MIVKQIHQWLRRYKWITCSICDKNEFQIKLNTIFGIIDSKLDWKNARNGKIRVYPDQYNFDKEVLEYALNHYREHGWKVKWDVQLQNHSKRVIVFSK